MEPATPVNFPTYTPPPAPTLTEIDTALGDTSLGKTQQQAQDLTSQLLELTRTQDEASQYRTQQENQAGYTDASNQIKEYTTQYNNLVLEQKGIADALQQEIKNRPGVSVRGAVGVEEMAKNRELASRALTVQSFLQTAQGNLAQAKETADRAVKEKYGDIDAKLNTLQKSFDIIKNSPQYTAEEKAQATKQSVLLQDRQAAVTREKEDLSSVYALANSAIKNNPGDQKVNMLAQQAIASGDLKKAFSLLGEYQSDPQEVRSAILDNEYKRAQIDNIYAAIRKVNADAKETVDAKTTANNMAKLDPNSPTFTMDMVQASAGGKTPTGEQTKPINKATLVLSQLADLQKNVSEADTGPILGILRDNNPYDVKAQLIKAQLQAITPNLARGVYGEVGVLTDSDIKNYIQTLPNLKKPEEANKLILAMTLKVVKNAVDSNLQVLAAEGRDVSGFEPILTRFDNKISELEAINTPVDANWLKTPNYSQDLIMARQAIANGKDKEAVKQMMLKKYKTVDL
jgi:vacuolar-type H+-ATPase subunit E/Vma4